MKLLAGFHWAQTKRGMSATVHVVRKGLPHQLVSLCGRGPQLADEWQKQLHDPASVGQDPCKTCVRSLERLTRGGCG